MASVPALRFNRAGMDSPTSVLPQSQVPGSVMENVFCKLPLEVARNVLSLFSDLADIVQLDSTALVHCYRESFQQLYQGITVHNCSVLKLNLPAVQQWIFIRAVNVQRLSISESVVRKWSVSFNAMMQEATCVYFEQQLELDGSTTNEVLSNCRQLRILSVSTCTIDADAPKTAMSLCPSLQEVDLSYTNARFSTIEPLLSPRIVSLCHVPTFTH